MNNFEKTAQRFIVSFNGTELTPTLEKWLLECRPGGVILFGRNIQSLEQITALNHSLQELAHRNGLPPFIITVDEEGGRVSRLPADAANLIAPSPMAQAKAGEQAVRDCARITATVLRSAGFNLDLTPLADVNNNPANPVIGTRSFGAESAEVARLVVAAVEEYTERGIGSCAKHFPGHGDTTTDSHLGFTVVDQPMSRLEAIELVPFRAAITANVPAIMTAHILYPQIDPTYPATLSHYWLSQVLRQQLGYAGLIITDALEMKAISDRYSISEAARLALQAGADMILPCDTAETQLYAIQSAAGLSHLELEEGFRRIMDFKERFCREPGPVLTTGEVTKFAAELQQVASESLFIAGEGLNFPLETTPAVIDFNLTSASPVEEARQVSLLLKNGLQVKWPQLDFLSLPAAPAENEVQKAVQLAENSKVTIVVLRKSRLISAQQQALWRIAANAEKLVVVAALDPYDLEDLPEKAVKITTYGDAPCSILALVKLLTGQSNA
jgi:beta-N-acetylhexosaminidase